MSNPFVLTVDLVTYEERSPEDVAEEGEPDSFPTFRVNGSFDGEPFETLVSVEFDGRDMDFETIYGLELGSVERVDFYDIQCALIEKLEENPEFKRVSKLYYGGE